MTWEQSVESSPKKFIPGFGQVTPGSGEVRVFAQDEISDQTLKKPKRFTYDSKVARNFDKTNVDRAREGVKEILKDAIAKAKKEAITIRDEARKFGFEEGFAEGSTDGFNKAEDEAKRDFAPLLETLNTLLAELSPLRHLMYSKIEREMVEMVIALTKRVIHHELSVKEESVQQMIRLGVQDVLDRELLVIRVNPRDKTHAENYRPELLRLFEGIKNIRIEGDPSIRRGGCLIETNFGSIDVRIEKLYEQIDRMMHMAPHIPESPTPPPAE